MAQFLDACRDAGERPLTPGDPVFALADDYRIPHAFLALAWREFKRRYGDTEHRQAGQRGWRQKFENAVRGNWYRLWWLPADGAAVLTTAGVQAQREYEAGVQRREAGAGAGAGQADPAGDRAEARAVVAQLREAAAAPRAMAPRAGAEPSKTLQGLQALQAMALSVRDEAA